MSTRTYGQFCGLARAVEIVGERWAMLIIRDLLVGPKRFGELQRGLPRIPTNILTSRLKALEAAGVVARRASSQPGGGVLYELTPLGLELEHAVLALGRWGAKNLLDQPRPDEIVTNDSMVMALRTTFRPEAAKGTHVSYELRMGSVVIHARIHDGTIDAGAGPLPDADLIVEAGPALKAVMAREVTPKEALAQDLVRVTGDPALFDLFAQIFRI
ncbi:MAG TPA: helix-turn-helix domain-containing protein [Candidatus Baltobacteraceae bacterium]|nr:helix-turn-helix domain-containing protein [Candidatus Baltobacteraceae bacterium]